MVLWFPFLIGRIRTEFDKNYIYEEIEFPFLIGRIRTKECLNMKKQEYLVSIPHR